MTQRSLNCLVTTLVKTVEDFKRWDISEWHGILLKIFGTETTNNIGTR
jgi:hypothetical protein